MKKKILMGIEVIVTFLFFLNVFHVAAAVVTSGNYSYEVLTDGTIRITSYNGNEKNVVVPATLDGKKVSRIRTLAFANKTELTTVTFSEGIENVEAYAFDNCTNLEKVTFPSTMLYISDLFYKKTPKITFHIPEGMERVESGEYLKLDHVTVHGVFEYDLAREVVEETNKHRKANGLNTLQIDNELMEAAMHRAAENAVYYNHIRPNGLDCFTILEHKIIKENIYASTMITNGAGMVTKWKNSGMHNQAMLFKDNVSIGVGVFYVNGVTYAVQLFSDDNSDDTSTKNEKIETTTKVAVSLTSDIISMHIEGLESTNTLKMGETLVLQKIKIQNTNFYGNLEIEATDVHWKSSDTNIFTVDANGKITAVGPGTAILFATLGNQTLTYEINVVADGISMSLDKMQLQIDGEGSTAQLQAKLSTGMVTKATWSSSNTKIATVDQNGVVTAIKGGFVYITAKTAFGTSRAYVYVCALRTLSNGRRVYPGDLDGNGVFNSNDMAFIGDLSNQDILTEDEVAAADINGDGLVNSTDMAFLSDLSLYDTFHPGKYISITNIYFNETSLTMDPGNTFFLTTTVVPTDNTDGPNMRWSSSNTNVAIVDSNGKVTAKMAGTAIIKVSSSSGTTAFCTINVNGTYVPIEKVTLNKTNLQLKEKDREQLIASIMPSVTSDSFDLAWSSSDRDVATVSSDGYVYAKSMGSTVITVRTSNGKTATCLVTVTGQEVAISGVSLNKTALSLEEGDIETLNATISPSNHTDSSDLTWSSSNSSIVMVDSTGKVTAKGVGTAVITVITANDKKATCIVTVTRKEIAISGVSLNKTILNLIVGNEETLKAIINPSNHTGNTDLTWSSSNNDVATVDSRGKVTAKGVGTATITVKTSNNKSATVQVKVTNIKNNYVFHFNQYKSTVESSLYPSSKFVNLITNSTERAYHNYDFVDEEGYYNSVYVDEKETTLYWTKYDKNMNQLRTLSWPLYYSKSHLSGVELDLAILFGGAVYYDKHLYVLYSQPAFASTSAEQYEMNVLALGKYDKQGNQIALKEYKAINLNTSGFYEQTKSEGTQIPFYGSASCSMTVNNGIIGVFFGKNRFDSHESSQLAFFDTEDLAHLSHINHGENASSVSLERRKKYSLVPLHTVSHSLGQRIITTSDGGYLIAEAGDAGTIPKQLYSTSNDKFIKTRGLIVSKLQEEYIEEHDLTALNRKAKRMFYYSEAGKFSNGNNILNSTIGNIIELDDGYMYIGAMEKELNGSFANTINAPHQLVVQKFKKNFYEIENDQDMMMLDTESRKVVGEKGDYPSGTKVYLNGTEEDYGLKFLTNQTTHTIMLVRAVKLENDDIAILWEQDEVYKNQYGLQVHLNQYETYYMIIDKNANIIVQPTKINNATMSGVEQYVYQDGSIYWTTTQQNNLVVNELTIVDQIKSVSFNQEEVNLDYGKSMKLNVTINPSNTAMDKTLNYTSSDSSVVSVDKNGNITGRYPGTAIIKVTSVNGKSDEIKVTVTGEAPYIKGDMNHNGKIDLTDILLLIKLYFGKIDSTSYYELVGDMNNNKNIDLTDILLLIKIYFGK